jgi:A/G-specific adenine glycosylase
MEALYAMVEPLCVWYQKNARSLPWREGKDPYHIWLSEVMLQQTRIEAVKPYYARFLAAAPTVADLAALPDDRLMKLWEGLGYYSRARNLKRAAQAICEQHGGRLPADYAALRALPGIGEYTAGAIASIAFSLPFPAVDGNVLRVVARLLGDESDVLRPETKKRIHAALLEVYRTAKEPAALTQGLMELGEVVCMPNRAPLCEQCPLAAHCRAYAEGSWDHIPYRAPKKGRKIMHKLILLLHDGEGRYAIRRRPDEGLLAGLWELPQIDLPDETCAADDDRLDRLAREFCLQNGLLPAESAAAPTAKHIFTHLEWHMCGRYLNVEKGKKTGELLFVSAEELSADYALPTAFRAYARYIHGK